ncbi:MAG: hypothetical protein AAFR47_05230 [Pseudomonadota bacterium]
MEFVHRFRIGPMSAPRRLQNSTHIGSALTLLLASVAWLAPASPAEARFTECRDLVEVVDPAEQRVRWSIGSLFDGAFRIEAEEVTAEAPQEEYLFTHRAGVFFKASCSDDALEEQEMYPIGVVVRKLEEVRLPAAGNALAMVVLTEYGQQKIVLARDVSPIEPDRAYLFSDHAGVAWICRDTSPCPGWGEEVCAGSGPDAPCRFSLNPFYGYAYADLTDAGVQEVLERYTRVRAGDVVEGDFCTPLEVHPMRPGGEAHMPYGTDWLSLCRARSGDGVSVGGLRVVDAAGVRALFDERVVGAFFRRPVPEGIERAIRAEFGDVAAIALKDCDEEIANVGSWTLGASLGAKLDAGWLEFALGVDHEHEATVSRTLRKEELIRFTSYYVMERGDDQLLSEGKRFGILMKSDCEGSVAATAKSIVLYYDGLRDGRTEILARRAPFELAAEEAGEDVASALQQTYFADWRERSLSPIEGVPDNLRFGQFWEITDYLSYFLWRDTLRTFVATDRGDLGKFVRAQPTQAEQVAARDFFAHLLLTAAFFHETPDVRVQE